MNTEEIKYAVSYRCKEMKSYDGNIMTKEGTKVWVHEGDFGPTASKTINYTSLITFDTEKEAKNFIKSFSGHPWYYEKRKQDYEIVEVIPNIITKQDGWKLKDEVTDSCEDCGRTDCNLFADHGRLLCEECCEKLEK